MLRETLLTHKKRLINDTNVYLFFWIIIKKKNQTINSLSNTGSLFNDVEFLLEAFIKFWPKKLFVNLKDFRGKARFGEPLNDPHNSIILYIHMSVSGPGKTNNDLTIANIFPCLRQKKVSRACVWDEKSSSETESDSEKRTNIADRLNSVSKELL